MANILTMLFSILILQASSKAAPKKNDLVISKSIEEDPKLSSVSDGITDQINIENQSGNTQRQKRYYDHVSFSFPPFGLPFNIPYSDQSHYSKRDENHNTGVNGANDALTLIYRRLQEIIIGARQHAQPSPPPAVPAYIPFLYIPNVGCGCTTNSELPSNQNQPSPSMDTTTPGLPPRFGGVDDVRQYWPVTPNSTSINVNVEDDGNRPISFDPVSTEMPIDVPVPPVEHGSVQAGAEPKQIATTTFRPVVNRPLAQSTNRNSAIAPTTCDAAVISCCLRSQITPNCFVDQGCPDTSIYGQPCDPDVVLNILNKVQYYYRQKNV